MSCVLFSLLPARSRLKQSFQAWSFGLSGPVWSGAVRLGGRKKTQGKGDEVVLSQAARSSWDLHSLTQKTRWCATAPSSR